MAVEVGFVLITHTRPRQALRLIRRLNQLYDSPPIVCHHDCSQCEMPLGELPGNVSLVQPHLRTAWGGFAVVEATVRAMRELFQRSDAPDWFVLLSGADYPIKPAQRVRRELVASACDAHLCYEPIDPAALATDWQRVCYRRYYSPRAWLPNVARHGPEWKSVRLPMWLRRPRHPFRPSFRCYAGSQWFSANRDAAECVLRFAESGRRFSKYCWKTPFTDEMYFQTILANAPGLRLNNANYRYTDWSAGGAHPKTLGMEDVRAVLASANHFARKFSGDRPEVLDALDRAVDAMAAEERSGVGQAVGLPVAGFRVA
jgi:hypothetical protein